MADKPKKPARWDEVKTWLLDDLTDEERLYVRKWILRYMNRWGQVPQYSSIVASRVLDKPKPPDQSA